MSETILRRPQKHKDPRAKKNPEKQTAAIMRAGLKWKQAGVKAKMYKKAAYEKLRPPNAVATEDSRS